MAENSTNVEEVEGKAVEDVDTENVDGNKASVEIKSPTFGFTDPSWKTDFCLVVEGTKLHVAKVILSLASPVFDRMFQSDFKEKSSDELELPEKKLSDVIAFLRCIYPDTCADINHDNALAILPLLEEYQVLQHKPKCEAVLLDSVTEETTTDELLQMLDQACMYDLKILRAQCISILSSRPCDVLDESFCKSFPSASTLNEIFRNVNKSLNNKLEDLEQVAEKYELLRKYISSEMLAKTLKDLKCNSDKKWDDNTIILIDNVPATNEESKRRTVEIWETSFKISIKTTRDDLICVIRKVGKIKVICDISAQFILVNKQPSGSKYVCHHTASFSQRSQTKEFIISNMSRPNEFESSVDGKIGIIIQLCVTQPYFMKR